MIKNILPIVEGKSEVIAIPLLLRRLLVRLERQEVQVSRPFWVNRNKAVLPGGIERVVAQGSLHRADIGAALVILDADDADPLELESSLLARCLAVTHLPVGVVAACREFEAWFLGSKDSLRGICGIRANAKVPENPESIRGAKERLERNMERGRSYAPTLDAPKLAAQMDIDLALRHCASFRRLLSELERILTEA